jgi:hypothetical protein
MTQLEMSGRAPLSARSRTAILSALFAPLRPSRQGDQNLLAGFAFGALVTFGACSGDEFHARADRDGGAGASEPAPGAGASSSGGAAGSSGAPSNGWGGGWGGGDRDATAPVDAAHVRDTGAEAAAPDATPFDACQPRLWYSDLDHDGYGRVTSTLWACESPGDDWAPEGGDCNDDNPDVHPGQTAYFAEPYKAGNGTESYDYDCSGVEEPHPDPPGVAPNCGGLSLGNCSGQGFIGTGRSGPGINAICGSTQIRTCVPGVVLCEALVVAVEEPKRCR